MSDAWFGLGGVVLGAVIAGVFGYALARRKEKADEKAEERREDVAVRRAARLIDADLLFAETAARMCVEQKKWWVKDRRLTTEAWQQHREVIASKLSWDDWLTVIKAVEAVDHLQGARDEAFKIQRAGMVTHPDFAQVVAAAEGLGLDIANPSPAIPDTTVGKLEPMLAEVQEGRAALAPLTRDA